jgi:hypothetical protein
MMKKHWKTITLLLIGLDVVVLGSGLVLSAFWAVNAQ